MADGRKMMGALIWVDRWLMSSASVLPGEPRGLYLEMLLMAWVRGAKLPNDPEKIRLLCRFTVEEWLRSWPVVQPYWQVEGETLYNATQREQYEQASRHRVYQERYRQKQREQPAAPPSRRRKPKPAADTPALAAVQAAVLKDTWMTPFCTAWEKRFGGKMPIESSLRPLSAVVGTLGGAEALVRFERYLESTDGKFVSVARFSQTLNEWSAEGTQAKKPGAQPSRYVPPDDGSLQAKHAEWKREAAPDAPARLRAIMDTITAGGTGKIGEAK